MSQEQKFEKEIRVSLKPIKERVARVNHAFFITLATMLGLINHVLRHVGWQDKWKINLAACSRYCDNKDFIKA